MLKQKWQNSLFATQKQENDWVYTPNQGALRCVPPAPLSRLAGCAPAVLSEPVGATTRNIDLLVSSSRLLLFINKPANPTGKRNYNPLPHRDSQGRQTTASMRLGGNEKAKPSRGEGTGDAPCHRRPSRDRTSNAVLAGPEGGRPRSNGAAVVFPLVGVGAGGSPHTKQR
jgi:hypothetical protein